MIKKFIAWTSIAVFIIIMLYMLTGCKTYVYNHQKTKAEKFYTKYPADLAVICAKSFYNPTDLIIGKDSVSVDTVYTGLGLPASGTDPSFQIIGDSDAVVNWHSKVWMRSSPGAIPFQSSPFTTLTGSTFTGVTTITTTHHRVDTLKIENTAKYDSLRNYLKSKADSIGSLKKQLSDKTALAKKYYDHSIARLWIIIGICVIAAVLIFLKFYL